MNLHLIVSGDGCLVGLHCWGLDNFIAEVFRLSPTVPGPMRWAKATCDIGEYRLEPDTTVLLCSYLAHHRAESFVDPLSFRPERFSHGSPPPETYFPFGNGRWRCPGARTGLDIVKHVVRTLLQEFDLDPCSPSHNPVALTSGSQTIRTKPLLARVMRRTSKVRSHGMPTLALQQ